MMEFPSAGAFAAHLKRVQAAMPAAEHAGLRMGAELIRDEAKAMLNGPGGRAGSYGPFEVWEPLATETNRDREKQGYPQEEPMLQRSRTLQENIECSVGLDRAAIGVPDRIVQLPYKKHPDNIGEIALDLEKGTAKMPPRSFLGVAAFRYGEAAAGLIASTVAAALAGMTLSRRRTKI